MRLRLSVIQYLRGAKSRFKVSTEFIFVMAAALLLVPIHWLCAWILALLIHELCHYIALRLCGGQVVSIRIGCRGVVMETEPLPLGREAICAYAGPIGALAIFFVARYVPRTAICTLVFSAYNLLPVFPLDGGRGLGCLLRKALPEDKATLVQQYIENSILIGIVVIAIYAVFRLGLGVLPATVAVALFWKAKGIKIPCKKRRLGLQ